MTQFEMIFLLKSSEGPFLRAVEGSRVQKHSAQDPSLRLKNGFARDDATAETSPVCVGVPSRALGKHLDHDHSGDESADVRPDSYASHVAANSRC